MAVVNGPGVVKLPVGKRTKVGTFLNNTDAVQFSISENSGFHLGSLLCQFVPNGTLTTGLSVALLVSLDGGVTFGTQIGVTPATIASTTTATAYTLGTVLNYAIPGLGGECSFQLQSSAFVLGTATKIDVWAIVA